jgi:hypothetical protein
MKTPKFFELIGSSKDNSSDPPHMSRPKISHQFVGKYSSMRAQDRAFGLVACLEDKSVRSSQAPLALAPQSAD